MFPGERPGPSGESHITILPPSNRTLPCRTFFVCVYGTVQAIEMNHESQAPDMHTHARTHTHTQRILVA